MRLPGATETMKLDHAEIRRLVERLGDLQRRVGAGEPSLRDSDELRLVLYGLYTLVMLHLRKEEESYLPLLDASLDEESARAMFERMHRAAAESRHRGAG